MHESSRVAATRVQRRLGRSSMPRALRAPQPQRCAWRCRARAAPLRAARAYAVRHSAAAAVQDRTGLDADCIASRRARRIRPQTTRRCFSDVRWILQRTVRPRPQSRKDQRLPVVPYDPSCCRSHAFSMCAAFLAETRLILLRRHATGHEAIGAVEYSTTAPTSVTRFGVARACELFGFHLKLVKELRLAVVSSAGRLAFTNRRTASRLRRLQPEVGPQGQELLVRRYRASPSRMGGQPDWTGRPHPA